MERVERSVVVNVPVNVAYNHWVRFERFPAFMQGVLRVERINPRRYRWEAEVAGRTETWEAEITEQVPNQVIAWRSVMGIDNMGRVTFEPAGRGGTRVTTEIHYEPQDWAEKLADAIGIVAGRVEGDLERFKDHVEQEARAEAKPTRRAPGTRKLAPAPTKQPRAGKARKSRIAPARRRTARGKGKTRTSRKGTARRPTAHVPMSKRRS